MLHFAHEVSQLVHSVGTMDTLAIKIASAEGSQLAQTTVAVCSDQLYNVIYKKASETMPPGPDHWRFTTFINKLAMLLEKPVLTEEQNLKIASAIATDVALSEVMQTNSNPKLAEARTYGREYLIELLRGVL